MLTHIQTFLTQNPISAAFTAVFFLGAICGILQTFIAGLFKNSFACLVFVGLVGYALVTFLPLLLSWLAITGASKNNDTNAFIYILVIIFSITCLDVLLKFGHDDERIYSFRDLYFW